MSSTMKERETNRPSYTTYRLVEITSTKPEDVVVPVVPQHQLFVIGKTYKITSKVLEKTFLCKAYIDVVEENDSECLDVVVMKQLSGPFTDIWSLTEADCEYLHIDYEQGLLVFPATYKFELVGKASDLEKMAVSNMRPNMPNMYAGTGSNFYSSHNGGW